MEGPTKILLKIADQIKNLAPESDVIFFAKQVNYLKDDFNRAIFNEEDYREALTYLNDRALKDSEFGINLAIVLTSWTFQNMDLLGLKTRNLVLHYLQHNHMQHMEYKKADVGKFYNSIVLMGEFYNRLKVNNNSPVLILGQSLLELLEKELTLILDKKETLTAEFGKLLLTLITQNGSLFKSHHEKQFTVVLDQIRRCLIEVRRCSDKTRAFLLMSLDIFYCNFNGAVFKTLQSVYANYLVKESETESQEDPEEPPVNKRQKVETVDQVAQTEVASFDVFRAGPIVIPPNERINPTSPTESTTSSSVQVVPTAPKSDSNESGVVVIMTATSPEKTSPTSSQSTSSSSPTKSKSKIDQRIRSVRIDRVYPNPVKRSPSKNSGSSSEDEVAKLSRANLIAHNLAMMKEGGHINRIRNGYLDNIPSTYDIVPFSSSSRSNELNGRHSYNGTRKSSSAASVNKYLMEENIENLTFDPAYFEDEILPASTANPHSQSFLQFLENK